MGRFICTLAALLAFKAGECNQFCRYQGMDSGKYADKYCVCVRKIKYSELSKERLGLLPSYDGEEESKPVFRIDEYFNFDD